MVTDVSTVEGRAATRMHRALKAPACAYGVIKSAGPVGQFVRFTWHFVQMVVVMMLGMVALGPVLSALGQSHLNSRSPEAYALAMLASMVIPMAAFMRIRGHNWERPAEMSAAMTVPNRRDPGQLLAGVDSAQSSPLHCGRRDGHSDVGRDARGHALPLARVCAAPPRPPDPLDSRRRR